MAKSHAKLADEDVLLWLSHVYDLDQKKKYSLLA
mgnify:CR=1 FL=1